MMNNTAANGYEMDWNSTIENDSPEWELLPKGEYTFTVEKYERARHNGSEKLPPCNKAILYLNVDIPGSNRTASIRKDLFLHSSVEGLLCAFFVCIGQRKHGERLVMNWNAVTGARGRCFIDVRSWIGNDGQERQSNEVKRFLEPDKSAAAPVYSNPAPAAPARPPQQTQIGYQPGRF